MKKKILLTCLVALMSTTSAYSYTGNCDGGTIVAGFCKSNVALNWWSAQAWCQANGSRLATMYEMCPSWDGNEGSGKCPELYSKGEGNAWSATAKGGGSAFLIRLSDGEVFSNSRFVSCTGYSCDNNYYAFCR